MIHQKVRPHNFQKDRNSHRQLLYLINAINRAVTKFAVTVWDNKLCKISWNCNTVTSSSIKLGLGGNRILFCAYRKYPGWLPLSWRCSCWIARVHVSCLCQAQCSTCLWATQTQTVPLVSVPLLRPAHKFIIKIISRPRPCSLICIKL